MGGSWNPTAKMKLCVTFDAHPTFILNAVEDRF